MWSDKELTQKMKENEKARFEKIQCVSAHCNSESKQKPFQNTEVLLCGALSNIASKIYPFRVE